MGIKSLSDVDTLLNFVGLNNPMDQRDYNRDMIAKFGQNAWDAMEAVDASHEGLGRNVYELKNLDPGMSLMMSAQASTPLYRALLNWMGDKLEREPKSVFDFGCDVGALTLLLAKAWPKTQIVGFDRTRRAIANAAKLAKDKGLVNAKFYQQNLTRPIKRTAELGILAWTSHEIFPSVKVDSKPTKKEIGIAKNLRRTLSDGGLLLTVNRFPYAEEMVPKFSEILCKVGFEEVLHEPLIINGPHLETFPIVCFE